MLRLIGKMVFGTLCVLAATAASSDARAAVRRASFTPVGVATSTPFGWAEFCQRYSDECTGDPAEAAPLRLSEAVWHDLEEINGRVNASIEPVSDLDHWGVMDQWDYPLDGRGDCEDYALLKRKILLARGYSQQSLLLTVVRDHGGEGHAVLTVTTDRGDFVLDNQSDAILAWDQTGYRYVKRQSPHNPNLWLAIGEAASAPATTAR
jgi:predicted transglutaminase-like cysteine proteinase